jgi:P4 family phage/plasmid primase-like protien
MLEAPYKTAFICHGPSDTGKTVLQSVMIDLVGQDKVCQIALDKLHDPSEIAPIKGKALNVVSELKYKALVSDDGFKRLISTGEPVQLNQKFQPRETYTPYCKHAVFTNELPHVTDLTDALYRRLLIVSFLHVIPKEKQDSQLREKLKQEQSGILLRALSGLKRLIENEGQFTLPEDHQKWVQEIKEDSNPLNEILVEYFIKDTTGYTSMTDVREIVRGKCPHMKGYRDKRITQLLKATGAEVTATSRDGQKGTFLLGYALTMQSCYWLEHCKHQLPVTGQANDPVKCSMQ